jgi:hypothetical protein
MKFITLTIICSVLSVCTYQIPRNLLSLHHQTDCFQYDPKTQKCIKCAFRTVLKDGKCLVVSAQCKTWDETSGLCTSCYGGYTLTDGVCHI